MTILQPDTIYTFLHLVSCQVFGCLFFSFFFLWLFFVLFFQLNAVQLDSNRTEIELIQTLLWTCPSE